MFDPDDLLAIEMTTKKSFILAVAKEAISALHMTY